MLDGVEPDGGFESLAVHCGGPRWRDRATAAQLDRVLAVLRRDQAGRELLPAPGIGDLGELARTITTPDSRSMSRSPGTPARSRPASGWPPTASSRRP